MSRLQPIPDWRQKASIKPSEFASSPLWSGLFEQHVQVCLSPNSEDGAVLESLVSVYHYREAALVSRKSVHIERMTGAYRSILLALEERGWNEPSSDNFPDYLDVLGDQWINYAYGLDVFGGDSVRCGAFRACDALSNSLKEAYKYFESRSERPWDPEFVPPTLSAGHAGTFSFPDSRWRDAILLAEVNLSRPVDWGDVRTDRPASAPMVNPDFVEGNWHRMENPRNRLQVIKRLLGAAIKDPKAKGAQYVDKLTKGFLATAIPFLEKDPDVAMVKSFTEVMQRVYVWRDANGIDCHEARWQAFVDLEAAISAKMGSGSKIDPTTPTRLRTPNDECVNGYQGKPLLPPAQSDRGRLSDAFGRSLTTILGYYLREEMEDLTRWPVFDCIRQHLPGRKL